MEKKKKTFPKALIIVICVISLVAMLSLSAFATTANFDNSSNSLQIAKINNDNTIDYNKYLIIVYSNRDTEYVISSITLDDDPADSGPVTSVTDIESELSMQEFFAMAITGASVTDSFLLDPSIGYTQVTPSLWDGVTGAVPTLLNNIGSTATAIVNNEYLALFCLVLPLLSLAVGLLIRMRDRT